MGAPYGSAHNATANPDNGYLQQETADSIKKLATATSSDCVAIAQLTATFASLTTELATVKAKLVLALQTNRPRQVGRGQRGRTSRRQGSGTGAGTSTGTRAGSPARTGTSVPAMA